MSTECSKCGADITYPAGSWPVGLCEPCDLRAERDAALARVAALEDALRPFAEAPFTTGEMDGSVGVVLVARDAHAAARAALAPSVPRTLETDLREDR